MNHSRGATSKPARMHCPSRKTLKNQQENLQMNRKLVAVTVLALAAASAAYACPPVLSSSDAARIDASSKPKPGEPGLGEIRAATAKYRDVNVALAEGYLRDPGNMCDTAEMMGKSK